ncbi:MAG: hypothetical protein LCH99_23235, partial [Proteobacteria bacterium]|nr:hypothetical protein [Pseudomonadota bacterium]
GSYRAFIDDIVSRRNAAHGKRIDAERSHLQALPERRTADSDEAAPLFRDDCAPGFRDDLAPCFIGVCRQ